jgi:hypothetical protein
MPYRRSWTGDGRKTSICGDGWARVLGLTQLAHSVMCSYFTYGVLISIVIVSSKSIDLVLQAPSGEVNVNAFVMFTVTSKPV